MKNSVLGATTLGILLACSVISGGCRSLRPAATVDPAPLAGSVEQPHAAVGADGVLLAVWGVVSTGGEADIAFARLGDDGEFTRAVRVNPQPASAVAGRQVGPRVAVTRDRRVLVSWVDRHRDPAGDIVLAASDDGGESFLPPVRVNDDSEFAGQEYHDLVTLPDGRVVLVWLDERDAGEDYPNQKQVYSAESLDGGRTFRANRRLTESAGGTCPCCRPDVAVSPDGSLHVAYRDRDGEDLVVRVRSRRASDSALGPAVTVSRRWAYEACPVNAPAIAAGRGGSVFVAWMDGATGCEHLRFARSDDHGLTFAPFGGPGSTAKDTASLRLRGAFAAFGCCRADGADDVVRGRPSLVASDDIGVTVAWEDSRGRVWVQPLARAGDTATAQLVADGGDSWVSRSVTLTSSRDGLHALWTEESVEWDPGDRRPPLRAPRHAVITVPSASN